MKLKFLRESKISYKGKELEIEVYKDLETNKLYIVDKKGNKLFLDGAMGEEIK
jgi:hypothetical protein